MREAMDVKTLVIDQKEVSARRGQTILQVARENDIDIPTLCHLDGLTDVGAYRMCVVEIRGSNKLLPACVTTVFEGMNDPQILDKHVRVPAGVNRLEGSGQAEAPRGTLNHHYKVDGNGLITGANLCYCHRPEQQRDEPGRAAGCNALCEERQVLRGDSQSDRGRGAHF